MKIQVSEPWNFKNSNGENIIRGRVIRIIDESFFIFKTDYNVVFSEKLSGNVLILQPRHTGVYENIDKISINGALFLGQYNDNIQKEDLLRESEFVLIGTLFL